MGRWGKISRAPHARGSRVCAPLPISPASDELMECAERARSIVQSLRLKEYDLLSPKKNGSIENFNGRHLRSALDKVGVIPHICW